MSDAVRSFVTLQTQIDSEFVWRWETVLELLEISGHVLGAPVAGGPVARIYHFVLGDWGVKVVWTFRDNVVHVRGARLS